MPFVLNKALLYQVRDVLGICGFGVVVCSHGIMNGGLACNLTCYHLLMPSGSCTINVDVTAKGGDWLPDKLGEGLGIMSTVEAHAGVVTKIFTIIIPDGVVGDGDSAVFLLVGGCCWCSSRLRSCSLLSTLLGRHCLCAVFLKSIEVNM